MSGNRRHIGTHDLGETPEPLNYRFLDHDGNNVDLTGHTATLWVRAPDKTETSVTAGLADAATGLVQANWVSADMTAQIGEYRAQFWVTDGTVNYPSIELAWRVKDGPGPA
jgi:hypothetical protein